MLYLNPPFHIIDGISVFADHADPLQWYFLPLMPKLTQIPDPAIGRAVPQIQLIKYRGRAGTGGFLNFDVNIGVPQQQVDDLRDEIKRLQNLRDPPRVAPVPLVDGTVRLMLLGRQTGDTAPAAAGEAPRFVVKMDHNAKPALYGDNQAAFSVSLDQAGVEVMEKALQGEMTPIGIVYALDYLALRPAYSVRLKVDWERVQHHLDESFGVDSIFFSSEIDKAVDKLVDDRVIVLEADTFVPEGEETAGIIGRRDQALNEVRDMVTDAFFTPSVDPVNRQEDGWDKALRIASRASAIAATGGWGGIGCFKYKKVDYTRIDKKSLNVNMSERTTVKRSIFPQGHLSGLLRVLRDGQTSLDRFVLSVDLDDPWFERRRVHVISRGNFEQDSIGSIDVTLRYGNEPRNVILESSTAKADLDWASIVSNGAMRRAVEASYKVTFKDIDGTERPVSLQSKAQSVEVDNLEINPRELYSIVQVPIVALSFPWPRYPQVEVQTRYVDEANGIRIGDDFLLDKDHQTQTWTMFVRDPGRTKFAHKLIYRAADNKDVELAWVETEDERVVVRDPFPQKRTLLVVPNFRWTEVERAFVDVSYEDPENDVVVEDSLEFKQGEDSKSFVVDLKNPDRKQVAYHVTVMFKDGQMIEIPRSVTLERRIVVRADMRGHRVVTIRPPAVDFAAKGLARIGVGLRYEDAVAGLSFADEFQLKSRDGRASFEFDYVDETRTKYEYQLTYLLASGLQRSTDWQQSDEDELRVPAA